MLFQRVLPLADYLPLLPNNMSLLLLKISILVPWCNLPAINLIFGVHDGVSSPFSLVLHTVFLFFSVILLLSKYFILRSFRGRPCYNLSKYLTDTSFVSHTPLAEINKVNNYFATTKLTDFTNEFKINVNKIKQLFVIILSTSSLQLSAFCYK